MNRRLTGLFVVTITMILGLVGFLFYSQKDNRVDRNPINGESVSMMSTSEVNMRMKMSGTNLTRIPNTLDYQIYELSYEGHDYILAASTSITHLESCRGIHDK